MKERSEREQRWGLYAWVGGDRLEQVVTYVDADSKENEREGGGPQLPGLNETGQGVFTQFMSKRVTIYSMQRKGDKWGKSELKSKGGESCQQHCVASYIKGVW